MKTPLDKPEKTGETRSRVLSGVDRHKTKYVERGYEVTVGLWDAIYQEADVFVIRSCWNYHERPGAFYQTLYGLDRVVNPAGTVRWNLDKNYLGYLIQPFLKEISAGEFSLIYFGGVYSHCVHIKFPPLASRLDLLIEPWLHFLECPEAADRFIDALEEI